MLALYLTSKNYNPFSITGRSALGVLSHPYVTSHVPKVTPQGHAARPKSHAAPQSHAAVSRRTSQKSCCSPKSRRRVTPHVPKVTLLSRVTPQVTQQTLHQANSTTSAITFGAARRWKTLPVLAPLHQCNQCFLL